MLREFLSQIPNSRIEREERFADGGAFYVLSVGTIHPATVRVWYLTRALNSEEIKAALYSFDLMLLDDDGELRDVYTLFVVDGRLLGPGCLMEGATVDAPRWLQILHGLNFGKVYVWQNRQWGVPECLEVLHLEWDGRGRRRVSWYRRAFQLDIDVRRSDTWVHGFEGWYKTAFFSAVPNWWLGQPAAPQSAPQVGGEAVRFTYDGRMTAQVARRILGVKEPLTINGVKEAYRELAKRYHPDLNASPEALRWMQAINAAYAYLENWSRL